MQEKTQQRLKHLFLATYLALLELLPFALAVVLVLITYSWFGASKQELWLLPEWWIATVFMLLEGMRDAVRRPHAIYADLDLIALVTTLASALLPACAFLVLLIAHSRRPAGALPDWLEVVQPFFLVYAVLVFLVAKGRAKFFELEASFREYQAHQMKP